VHLVQLQPGERSAEDDGLQGRRIDRRAEAPEPQDRAERLPRRVEVVKVLDVDPDPADHGAIACHPLRPYGAGREGKSQQNQRCASSQTQASAKAHGLPAPHGVSWRGSSTAYGVLIKQFHDPDERPAPTGRSGTKTPIPREDRVVAAAAGGLPFAVGDLRGRRPQPPQLLSRRYTDHTFRAPEGRERDATRPSRCANCCTGRVRTGGVSLPTR
jgi:hypothetical protein